MRKIMDNSESNAIKLVKIPSSVTIKRLSEILDLPASRILMELLKNKIIVTINEEIDFETAAIIAQDLGFSVEESLENSPRDYLTLEKLVEFSKNEAKNKENTSPRPPIVTILGHVDHGKTTLLDAIRKTNVVAKEAGGITQHISAYQVKKKGKIITFIDTPGHEAFSAMRERGVSIADVAVLVVAADDGVKPQTKEVVEYLKIKKIPTVVAINKVDKPEANIKRVKQELAENGILLEGWGGNTPSVEVSAKKGVGIDDLLESIIIVSEIEDFRADPKREGMGVVLEAHLDSKKGPVATILVKTGTLKVGQDVIAGTSRGRIRKMEDFSGISINSALPSMPVTIIGLDSVSGANDVIYVADRAKNNSRIRAKSFLTDSKKELFRSRMEEATSDKNIKKLRIVLKTDVQGSLEAIKQILSSIKSDEVAIEYISEGIGNITESDVKIAESAGAKILGFNVIITPVAKRMAESGGVGIKLFNIIYELVEDVKKILSKMLPVEIIRTDLGKIKVLAIFKTGKRDMIVGGRVFEGKMIKGMHIEVKREKEIIGKGTVSNLQQNKSNVEEVGQGNECGITFEGDVRIKEGDVLVCFKEEEKENKL